MKFVKIYFLFAMVIAFAQSTNAQCPGQTEVLINIVPDNYGSETTWEVTGPGGSPVYGSGGPYTDGTTTPVNASVCVPNGVLAIFTINDSYGDGICCSYGNGSYTVTIGGSTVASGGLFTTTESTVIMGTPQPFDCMMQTIVSPFPHVASNEAATISGSVMNIGSTTVTEVSMSYQVGTGTIVTESIGVSSAATFGTFDFEFTTPWTPASTGQKSIKVWINSINLGNTDLNPANDTAFTMADVYQATIIPNILDNYLNGAPTYSTVLTSSDQLDGPMDLDFHPYRANELWVISEEDVPGGGTTVTASDAGMPTQTSVFKADGNNWHFMSLPTGIAFGTNGNWANSPGVFDANHNGSEFTGPALWSSDMSIYAVNHGPGTNGSHLDMLHESPHSMGIAHHKDNAYWIFDGWNTDIVLYDFKQDHGPGMSYHGDAHIYRYEDINVARDATDPMIPSHMVEDKATGWLYIVDVGNDRVFRMNTNTGTLGQTLTGLETVEVYRQVDNAVTEAVIDTGLVEPCGVDIVGDRMIVSDYSNGDIRFYDITNAPAAYLGKISTGAAGITGVKVGPAGNIWYSNRLTNEVRKIEPAVQTGLITNFTDEEIKVFPNPASELIHIGLPTGVADAEVQVVDVLGREVLNASFKSKNQLNIDCSEWTPGVYVLNISNGAKTISKTVRVK